MLRWFPTLTETFVYREIQGLLSAGQPVIIAAMGARADGRFNDALPDVPVWRRAFLLRARLARVCRVHAHFEGESSALALQIARGLGVPFSVTVHAAGLFRPRAGILHRLRCAAPAITVCVHHQAWILHHYGVEAKIVRCGVDLLPQTEHRHPARVLSVARDTPKKDLARLVDARILSHCPPSQVRDALAKADLFALPCRVGPLGSRDGVPVAMMEAMSAGVPVVTRPVSGIPELVDDSVGWISEDFESALQEAKRSPEARLSRGRAARDRIRSGWTIRHSVQALLAAWASVPR